MMEKLKETSFGWHADLPDIPGKTASEMKAFFDAPNRVFLDKINELVEALQGVTGTTEALTQEMKGVEKLANRAEDIALVLKDDPALQEATYPTVGAVASYVGEMIVNVYGALETVRQTANEGKGQAEDLQVQLGEGFSEGNTVQMRIDELWQSVIDLEDSFRRNLSTLSGDMGKVDAAIDSIISLQQSFIGGDAA